MAESPNSHIHAAATQFVAALNNRFCEQVQQALSVTLDYSKTSLAFVDHYLQLAREEDREPILSLLAAGAGAYFGNMICRELGAMWIGDGSDPRRLRLLLSHQLIHFSPMDQAFEAIIGGSMESDDPRHPPGMPIDSSFHLSRSGTNSEQAFVENYLAQLTPLPEEHFYSLTARFETLELILELLANKQMLENKQPVRYEISDYLHMLTETNDQGS